MAYTDDDQEKTKDLLRDRGIRFLDYLAAVANSQIKPVRTFSAGSDVILSSDVPNTPLITLGPSDSRNAWLTVRQAAKPVPAEVPTELKQYIVPQSIATTTSHPKLNDSFTSMMADARREAQENDGQPTPLSETVKRVEETFHSWTEQIWIPWTQKNRKQEQAFDLYQKLFNLYLRLDQESDYFELVFGHCVLTWKGRKNVTYPLILTSMHLIFREETGTIEVEPESTPRMVLDPADKTDLPGYRPVLTKFQEEFNVSPIDLWNSHELDDLEQGIARGMGPNALLSDEMSTKATSNPTLHRGWVLMLRKRTDNRGVFYQSLAHKMRSSDKLPVAFETVFSDTQTMENAFGQELRDDGTGQRLLMPLPANDEQQKILRNLSHSSGVTVQGPPGTGKSHTIVNLVSHLLAQGKRILVTAEKEQALAVLKDKMPDELKDLTVAAIGSSPAENAKLRLSVQQMQDSLANLDINATQQRIVKLNASIDAARDRLTSIDGQLCDLLAAETSTYSIGTNAQSAESIAKLVSGDARSNIIPDGLSKDAALPLDQHEFERFVSLSQKLSPDDARYDDGSLPNADDLPSAEVLEDLYNNLNGLNQQVQDLQNAGLDMAAFDSTPVNDIAATINLIQQGYDKLSHLDQNWEQQLGKLIRDGSHQASWIEEGEQRVSKQLMSCLQLSRERFGHVIAVPEDESNKQLGLLQEWKDRVSQGKGIPRLLNKDLRDFSAEVTIDGNQPKTTGELDLVRGYIEERQLLIQLDAAIKQSFAGMAIPFPAISDETLLQVSDLMEDIRKTFRFWQEDYPSLEGALRKYFPYNLSAYDTDRLRDVIQTLRNAQARQEQTLLLAKLDEISHQVENHSGNLWKQLAKALVEKDTSLWSSTLDQSAELYALEQAHRNLDQLYERMAATAPQWAKTIVQSRGDANVTGAIDAYQTIWELAKARKWVSSVAQSSKIDELMQESQQINGQLQSMVIEDVNLSARLHLKQSQKPSERRSLQAWLDAIKKVGKGTGKNAARYMSTARHELPHAMNAMPVWIMPLHRVLDNFDPEISHLFDVIIVDESSQCDLLSVGVLALAQKAIIVGDDKQTSPSGAFKSIDEYTKLQEQYIPDFAEKTLFSTEESLYSIANRTFGSRIMLREHFRCVPEIIEYSNRFYAGKVFPLRERTHLEIGSPLRACYVPNAISEKTSGGVINITEADALTEQVVSCINDPRYANLTFGVVTLMSGDQQTLIENKLKDAIGTEEYAKRRLRVGNPPAFQGDERNVIFLSFVSSSTDNRASKEQYAQWMNVAASRAQDQLWAFYSMDADSLSPTDYRKGLIEYIRDHSVEPEPVDVFAATQSTFEQDVLRDLLSHGYGSKDLALHYKVGRYDIDCVITIAPGLRLALECDGDGVGTDFNGEQDFSQDIKKQRVLERLGWHFIRLSSPAYYFDREQTMRPVWQYLDKLKEHEHALSTLQHGTHAKPPVPLSTSSNDSAVIPEHHPSSPAPVSVASPTNDEQYDSLLFTNSDAEPDVLELLSDLDIEYVDKRPNGGNLWAIGGIELTEAMRSLGSKGYHFTFRPAGGRVTHGVPAWWME